MTTPLREGFSTGSAATAAAMAALEILLSGQALPSISTPMPPDALIQMPLDIPLITVERLDKQTALAAVIKDGGDDPDATHKARIEARVHLMPHTKRIDIDGGIGVGRVTLPGLPVAVGMAAINPSPRAQILRGIDSIAQKYAYDGGMDILIEVPQGEEIARHTFNPRLGIMGGISILGTQGTVRPYSHKAWKATITQGLHVALATGCTRVCLSTGRRSEKLLLARYPHTPEQAAVQVADFAQFSLKEAGKMPFTDIVWGCFFGKLVKLAQGHAYTHAKTAALDFDALAKLCLAHGFSKSVVESVRHCVTAQHALEILLAQENPHATQNLLKNLAQDAVTVARNFAGPCFTGTVHLHVFHLDGSELIHI